MSLESAQWEDWKCIADMLEVASTMGSQSDPKLIYDDVDALISLIRASDVYV